MTVDRAKAKEVYESSLKAGYPFDEAKARVKHFVDTGEVPVDPTEQVWAKQIKQESGGKQSAVSPKGATGIAQVMPKTGPEAAALADLQWDPVAFKTDPAYNEALGRAYMRKQIQDFGNVRTALAAYNAGPERVRKVLAGESTLPAETRDYVTKLAPKEPAPMTRQEQIKAIYNQVKEAGGGKAELQAELEKAFGARKPVETSVPLGETTYGSGWQPAPGTKIDRLQALIEQDQAGGTGSQVLAGAERSALGNIQGVRKLINQATGDSAEVDNINTQNQRAKDFWEGADPTGSGISPADIGRFGADVGTFAAGPGGGATGLGKILAGAGTGALQGLIAPTTAQDSQAGNALIGGILGGTLPAIGVSGRKLVGTENANKVAAVNALRNQGVEVPAGAKYDSPIAEALSRKAGDTMPEVGPGVSKRLADLAGAPDLTNEVIENTQNSVGQQLGSLFKGLSGTPKKDFNDKIMASGAEYLNGLNTSAKDPVIEIADDLLSKHGQGQPLSGELYQKYRSQLGSLSTKGTADEKQAFRGMKNALDDLMKPMLNGTGKEGQQEVLNAQYRLLKILRSGRGIPAEGITPGSLLNKVETAKNKGAVNPDVRALLRDAVTVAPRTKLGVDEAVDANLHDVPRGLFDAIVKMAARGANSATRRGIPQAAFNSEIGGKAAGETTRNALLPILLRLNSGE